MKKDALKQKVRHELVEFFWAFLYLALLLCSLAAYTTLMLDEVHVRYFAYGAALINALVLSKVILLGEYAHLGKKQEDKPLIVSTLYKSLLFGLLVLFLHVLEGVIKRSLYGHEFRGAFHLPGRAGLDELLIRSLVVFCTLLPFFAVREIRRVLGEGRLFDMFFRRQPAVTPKDSPRDTLRDIPRPNVAYRKV